VTWQARSREWDSARVYSQSQNLPSRTACSATPQTPRTNCAQFRWPYWFYSPDCRPVFTAAAAADLSTPLCDATALAKISNSSGELQLALKACRPLSLSALVRRPAGPRCRPNCGLSGWEHLSTAASRRVVRLSIVALVQTRHALGAVSDWPDWAGSSRRYDVPCHAVQCLLSSSSCSSSSS